MFCINCGKEIPDGALFCISCGQKVDEGVAQQVAEQAQSAQQPIQQQVSQPIQQQVMRPAPQVAPQNVSQEQNNKKLIWVIIGVAAAFLIVAIVFGILILGKLGDNDKDDYDKKKNVKTEQTSDDDGDIADAGDQDDVDDLDDSEGEDVSDAGSDDMSAYISERFPNLVEGYKAPKSENTFWINIDDATRAKLEAVNDYNKIAWVVEYAFRDLPDVVVSFTINDNSGVPYVFLAFTNVGEVPVSIDGTADLYDFDNTYITSGYPYTGMLQPGGTYMCPISCPGADENNIDIGFTELNMDFPAAKPGEYSYEAELGASTNNSITTSISVTNTGDKKESMGQVTVLLVDENGFPVANGYVFAATSTDAGATLDSDVTINILGEDIDKIDDIVLYASPYITG